MKVGRLEIYKVNKYSACLDVVAGKLIDENDRTLMGKTNIQ